MNRFVAGIVAGLVATIVLSALLVLKTMLGLLPAMNTIAMLSAMAGSPGVLVVGWLIHFGIGTVLWGLLFAAVSPTLPGAPWIKGITFAIGAWLLMMVVVLPMAGQGLFGSAIGIMAPVATLMLHLVYGTVLGGVYGALLHRSAGLAP